MNELWYDMTFYRVSLGPNEFRFGRRIDHEMIGPAFPQPRSHGGHVLGKAKENLWSLET
jgi:hypothetical protein